MADTPFIGEREPDVAAAWLNPLVTAVSGRPKINLHA